MHPDLSPHLHTEECNTLIKKLKECHEQKYVGKFFGVCNDINNELNKCLRLERENRRKQNFEKAKERQAKVRKSLSEV